jgi:hypothetical protein
MLDRATTVEQEGEVVAGPAQHVMWPKSNIKIKPFFFFLTKIQN